METLKVIVGCNGNIGSEITKFELENSSQIVIGIDIQKNSSIFNKNPKFVYLPNDCTSPVLIEEFFKENYPNSNYLIKSLVLSAALDSVPKNKGEIDLYNFGLKNQKFKEIQERINVNITSQIFMLKIFEKYLYEKSHTCLFSSIYGLRSPDQKIYSNGFLKPLEYSTSKSSILNMTKHFAITSALEKKGRCNCLVLGGIENDLQSEAFRKEYIKKIPLRRMGNLKDVVNAYKFLTSDESAYITGTSLIVDGGYTSW